MNLCLLSETYPPEVGGVARSAQRLAQGLVEAGHTVHLCTLGRDLPPGQVTTREEAGVLVHRLGPHRHWRDTLTDWFELAVRLGRESESDLYHGHFLAYAGFLAAFAAHYLGRPALISARGNDMDRLLFDPARGPYMLEALRLADVVAVVSHDLARKVRVFAPQAAVHHVPNGVDGERFRPGPPAPLREEVGPGALLGFVGEARLKKGLVVLLSAFARVAARRPAHLFLVGGVREKDRPVLDLFRRRHPHLSIHVVPYLEQDQLPAYYNALDLVLLPSLRDGLPNALLEAMACGRPVVATPVGGIADVIEEGVTGFLVPPGDDEALAQRILALLDAPEQRAAVGEAARRQVLRRYTTRRELESYLRLYEELVARP
ncbi:MAG: glycosyltransferase family 4 protein [Chloroflexi bacterium]|nr:MAG: glycosyltransferase family 4 protein [Chloroflexota bacterium]